MYLAESIVQQLNEQLHYLRLLYPTSSLSYNTSCLALAGAALSASLLKDDFPAPGKFHQLSQYDHLSHEAL